jgi:broad specificity phosphatase PhoE
MRCLFITHTEVVVQPLVPTPLWHLAEHGRRRARGFAASGALAGVDLLISSTETKAVETADLMGEALGLPTVRSAQLGENDRSSTGFLPRDEFERTADAFFAEPDRSIRGWEPAIEAQDRIVSAVQEAVLTHAGQQIAFVAHGAVGTLLLCTLRGVPISRAHDQPRQGSWYAFDAQAWQAESGWLVMPD